jgi:hypothetical protein
MNFQPVGPIKLPQRADLSIRPAATDEDAISLREALYFNCPVIASDVVRRPKGTILFNRSLSVNDPGLFNIWKLLWKIRYLL